MGSWADPGSAVAARRLLIVSSIRWNYLWQRHQALAVAAANDGWQVDFLQPRPRTIRQVLTFPLRALRREVLTQDHGEPPLGVTILGPRHWLRPRARPSYDVALVYLPDRMTESFVLRNGVRKVIYDAVLDWSTVPSDWFPPLGWRSSERRIAGWAHSALATDAEGMALVLADRGYFAEVVPPAADDAFVEAENVADVDRKPRALYFGSVRPEVDVRALVALRSSGVDVDVVGPVADSDLRTQLVEAGIKVGVPIGVAELACLAATYRVIVLPYRGERASTLMPAKFWNCVATGAWVVCKDLETPRLPTVRTTHSTEDFVTAVLEALDTPVEQSRSESPTWHTRWRRMLAIAGEVPREGPDNL